MTGQTVAAVIVLAAGAGTRMKSELPKVLHPVCGRSMVHHALLAARGLNPEHIVAVIRHQRDKVAKHIEQLGLGVTIADQDDQPGTGRAVECGLASLSDVRGVVVVTYGDVPLLSSQTLSALVDQHRADGNAVTVITANLADPTGYGRIVRDADGQVREIVEQKDCTPEQLAIVEGNSGIYAFDAALLADALPQLDTNNSQGEKYLTDVIGIARAQGLRVGAVITDDVEEISGVNDRIQLAAMGQEMNARILRRHMTDGVSIVSPATTWIGPDVVLAQDVTLLPGVQLHGSTAIGKDSVIGPDTTLTNVVVGERSTLARTHAQDAVVDDDVTVGPFAYLRPGTRLRNHSKVGTFVETKKADVGEHSKVPHLSYVGDATIGTHTNIGAATVFVNYDGVTKHHTTIGDHCRTGSDNMFVAPVAIGDGAYTGAGTVVRKDVPPGALAINVAPQRNMLRWVIEKRPDSESARAAESALSTRGADLSANQEG